MRVTIHTQAGLFLSQEATATEMEELRGLLSIQFSDDNIRYLSIETEEGWVIVPQRHIVAVEILKGEE